MQALGIHAQVAGVHEVLDNLTESQCDDGQIIAGQTQDRDADQEAEDTSHNAAHHKGQQQRCRLGEGGVIQADPHQRTGKSAHAHKPGVAQAQLAQHADGQVQGDSHDNVCADRHQLTREGVGDHACGGQDLDQQIEADDDAKSDDVALGGAVQIFQVHRSHLTLSR